MRLPKKCCASAGVAALFVELVSSHSQTQVTFTYAYTVLLYTKRVRPPNGGHNEANSWETGS